MKKPNNQSKNDINTPKNDSKELPEFEEFEVYEAQIDRIKDISPKNDKESQGY